MQNKVTTVEKVIAEHCFTGMSVLLPGFVNVGVAESLIDGLLETDITDLQVISNNTSVPGRGIGKLVRADRIRKITCSHIGNNSETCERVVKGEINITFCPQGSLCEKVRAGGAGIGGILTPTGVYTPMQDGKQLLEWDNEKGEFLNKEEGNEVLRIAEAEDFEYADVDHLGSYREDDTYDQKHIDMVLGLDLVDVDAIKKANFRVAFDSVNSVGGVILPKLFQQLGVQTVTGLFTEPTGDFQHNPEPLEKNLADIKALMQKGGHDIGFVVDPDVDRLALFCEDGTMYGEEYTLVTVADYILQHTPGNTVSNLSSTRALRDVTRKYGCEYNAAAVGEVNVVTKMKDTKAVIGGEGNGGVIYPAAHYGRDALVGIALILTYLAKKGMKTSELRATYPPYFIAKNRIDLTPDTDVDAILAKVKELYKNEEVNDIDGVKIDFPDKWVHLRKSNTEPIIRVYSEASTMEAADEIGKKIMDVVYSMV